MANLAFTYWDTGGRNDDAFRWMERCAEARAQFLGPEHPDTRFAQSTIQKWRTGLPTPRTREHWRRWRLMITGTMLLIYRACQIVIRSTMISIRAKSRNATMRNVD
ncbi:hypothetical protein GGS24DRAFT_482275 [Hypoxylon argillaceum]|nr:hypothetical protein GGS24DRAFT_482275 [Hypoxylon argillaceum]